MLIGLSKGPAYQHTFQSCFDESYNIFLISFIDYKRLPGFDPFVLIHITPHQHGR